MTGIEVATGELMVKGKEKLYPDICNSFSGCVPPQDYCRECSHAHFRGVVESNGKNHRFEFNPQFGVTFLKAEGGARKVQPAEKNPVWDAFGKWYDEKFTVRLKR